MAPPFKTHSEGDQPSPQAPQLPSLPHLAVTIMGSGCHLVTALMVHS